MGIVAWIILGFVAGIIATPLMPGPDPGGFVVTILLGIAGAFVGGFVGRAFGFLGPNAAAGWMMPIAGSVLLLLLYRVLAPKRPI